MTGTARALWYVAPGRADLRAGALGVAGPDEALVRTRWSGISRGTERLVLAGRVPEDERARMRAPMQEGDFPFPVKYGYCAVGIVEDGPPALVADFSINAVRDLAIAEGKVMPVALPPDRLRVFARPPQSP